MSNVIRAQISFQHQPGSYVSSSRTLYRHVGIVTDKIIEGQQTVISNTGKYGKVVEQTIEEFCDGGDLVNHGRMGSLPTEEILSRARRALGKKYSILTSNCEHFVRHAYGVKEESPQVQTALIGMGVMYLMWRMARN